MRSPASRCLLWRCISPTSMVASRSAGTPCSRQRRLELFADWARSGMISPSVDWPRSSRRARPPAQRVVDQRQRRLAALLDGLTAAHVDALLVTSLANVRYLTGFSGSSALLLVSQRETVLITDFRYQTQAGDEVGDAARVLIEPQSLWSGLWQQLAQMAAAQGIGFESAYLLH